MMDRTRARRSADAARRAAAEREADLRQEEEFARQAERVRKWIADGRPCRTSDGHHTERTDLCAGCLPLWPSAPAAVLECPRPERYSDSDGGSVTCRNCWGNICPCGRMHVGGTMILCALCL